MRRLHESIRRRPLLAAVLALIFIALPASAAFRATVTGADAFRKAELRKVAVVTVECDDSLDCSAIERKVFLEAQKLELGFEIVPENVIRSLLFKKGFTSYTSEHRALLSTELGIDGLIELKIPFAEKGDGPFGRRKSRAKVELTIIRPDGEILLHGVGTGRPLNVVTAPERVAGNVVERIFEKIAR